MLRGGDPILHDPFELLRGHAGMGGHDYFEHYAFAAGECALHVALEQRGEGFLVLPLGMLRSEHPNTVERGLSSCFLSICQPSSSASLANSRAASSEIARAFHNREDQFIQGLESIPCDPPP
jgi:hypothetical protein